MAGYTSRHALPYPQGVDRVAAHVDIQRLAEKVDVELTTNDPAHLVADAEQRINDRVDTRLVPVQSGVVALRDDVAGLDGRVSAVETLAGLEPGDVSDATVASLVGQGGTNTRAALDDLYSGAGYTVDAATYGVVADGATDDSAAIQAAVADMPEGSTLEFPPDRAVRLGSPFTVDRPARIKGGKFLTDSGQAIVVTSTDVHIDGAEIIGPGTDTPYVIRNHGIHVEGTESNRLRVVITNCKIRGMRDSAIWLEHVQDFIVDGNHIEDFRYAGVWVASGKNGRITGNTVKDAVWNQTTECYGMAMTGRGGEVANRSENIIIAHNHVMNIPDRTGIDTHGGMNVTVAFNQVLGCRSGITGTTGNNDRNTAPVNMVIIGNTVVGDPDSTWITAGIAFGGSPDDHPLDPIWANLMAMSNIIRGVSIPINLPGTRGEKVDRALSQIKHNVSDVFPITEVPVDSGGTEVVVEHLGDGVYRIGE